MATKKDDTQHVTVSLSTARAIIQSIIDADTDFNIPIFLHSRPGVGKSAIVAAIAKHNNMDLIDLRLSMMEASTVGGIPFVNPVTEEMEFSTPPWFPTDENSRGILFLDELSNAVITTQHAGYMLVHDRAVTNGKKLPKGWITIAAGNLKSDKTGARDIAPALANRFGVHLYIESDKDEWTGYAVSAGIDERIVGFVNFRPDLLYTFDPSKNEAAFATQRSWEKASHLLKHVPESVVFPSLAGCVGPAVASEFMAFCKYYHKLPDFEKIMDGKEEYTIPQNEKGLVFAIVSKLIYCVIENIDNKTRTKNLTKDGGLIDQLHDEFKILLICAVRNGGGENVFKIFQNYQKHFKNVQQYIPTK